jgi:hypothetical protein
MADHHQQHRHEHKHHLHLHLHTDGHADHGAHDQAQADGSHPHAKRKLEDEYVSHLNKPARGGSTDTHSGHGHNRDGHLMFTPLYAATAENADAKQHTAHDGRRQLMRAAETTTTRPPLNTSDSVEKLVADHKFVRRDQPAEGDGTARDIKTNPVKNVDVVYQDNSGDKTRKTDPDFRVHKDGTIEVLHDPDRNTRDKVVVEVERAPGERGAPPAVQQQAIDQLVGYLAGRYIPEKTNPDGSKVRDGRINDAQGLVSDSTKKAAHTQPTDDDKLPPEAREEVHRVNRWHGSGGGRHGGDGGRFTPQQARDEFARRDVPRQPGEDDKLAALKDVASGFISRGEREPYHAVKLREGRGHIIGRYGISSDQFLAWLMGLSDEEIARLIKEGKLPKGALDLKHGENSPAAQQFQDFLDKMKSGQGNIDAKQIDRFLPKELQERIGSDLIKQYAFATADKDAQGRPAHVNIGKVALSMVLGHAATDEEAKRPEYQGLMKAAEQAYPLALEHAMDGTRNIDLSDAARKIVAAARGNLGQALWRNHAAATEWGNLGCAASVSAVLRDAGVANVDQLGVEGLASALKNQGWRAYSFEQRQPGDVIIALGPRDGHTGVVGENRDVTYDNHSSTGRWSPDHASYWRSGRWPTVYVMRPPSA